MTVVTLEGLTKSYDNGSVVAINDVNLKVDEGEFVLVLGRSGSGKSTLLSLIGGLEIATKGKIKLWRMDISSYNLEQLANLRRSRISYIFQHFHLLDNYTILENVLLPKIIQNCLIEEDKSKALDLLNSVGLSKKVRAYPGELSGGEKQRVGIARALFADHSLILVDEPTGNLDSTISTKILDLLYQLHRSSERTKGISNTTIMVTHDLSLIRPGMRVILLHGGQLIKDIKSHADSEVLRQTIMKLI